MTKSADKTQRDGILPPEFETEPFLESLTELDAPTAARRLRERLDALAKLPTTADARYSALSKLDSRVASVAATLAGRHLELSLPLSAPILEELEAIRQLHQAHARAWMSIFREMPEKGTQQLPHHQRELQARARVRALQALTEVLLSSSRYYRDPPKGLWRDIHQTYWGGVYADAVGMPRHDEEIEADLAYTRVLLLGLCGTGQFPDRAIDRVAAALGREWKLESLIKSQATIRGTGKAGARYLIDPNADYPATPCLPGVKARPTDQILDTEALIVQLRSRFENLAHKMARECEAGKLPDYGELELLRTLIGKWGGAALRRRKRTPVQNAGRILGGLRRIHEDFSAGRDGGDPGSEIVLSAAELLKNSFRQTTAGATVQWLDILFEDQADEGLRIRMQGQTGVYLTVGDLVCIGGGQHIAGAEIGVIVRARVLAVDEVEFGIRRLGPALDTAYVHLVGQDATPGDFENLGTPFRALVLQGTPSQPELLVADKGLYRPGATLWASWGGDTRILRAGALILSTRNFDAFAFTSTASAVRQDSLFAKPVKRTQAEGGNQDTII